MFQGESVGQQILANWYINFNASSSVKTVKVLIYQQKKRIQFICELDSQ